MGDWPAKNREFREISEFDHENFFTKSFPRRDINTACYAIQAGSFKG